ncbi:hypothetical protein GCM10020331_080590 [Ectobacillus funiculus]
MEERVSDQYAMEMTEDKKAAVETFQDLSKNKLKSSKPTRTCKTFFLYTHPTMLERITYLEEYGKK